MSKLFTPFVRKKFFGVYGSLPLCLTESILKRKNHEELMNKIEVILTIERIKLPNLNFTKNEMIKIIKLNSYPKLGFTKLEDFFIGDSFLNLHYF